MRILLTGLVGATLAAASDPASVYDSTAFHPYRFVPAYGHASQSPGSPRWFAPGYGYAIPGFVGGSYGSPATLVGGYGWPSRPTSSLVGGSYGPTYALGRRRVGFGLSAAYPFSAYSYGGPWYHPGSSTNLAIGRDVWAVE